eukprot:CAMPEP_0185736324 /NCGR_PEP_ID=MMETSP1171-20130828/27548_1 /TAXON_ID=374046 /ORGANISM="Helicotheca tamensis, Strain CCMP826" /LENGTH=204 /DNA_ID=CAMNT_0028406893 /DNA_START=53 /DNA_END=667 /DNA_ORIENTATION=+
MVLGRRLIKAIILTYSICFPSSASAFTPQKARHTGKIATISHFKFERGVGLERSISRNNNCAVLLSSQPSANESASKAIGACAASLLFLASFSSPANAVSVINFPAEQNQLQIDTPSFVKSLDDNKIINSVKNVPGIDQYKDILNMPLSSVVLSAEQEISGGMSSGERKAGEWFFVAYVVFSLLAGAKEMTVRFQKWRSGDGED